MISTATAGSPAKKRRKLDSKPSTSSLIANTPMGADRPKLKSTSELVAAMTRTLPEELRQSMSALPSPAAAPSPPPASAPLKTTKKRRKSSRTPAVVADEAQSSRSLQTPPVQQESKVELVKKFLDSSVPLPPTQGRDWYADLPAVDANAPLELRFNTASSGQLLDTDQLPDTQLRPLRSRFLSAVGERQVLGLPYLDIGMPDFYEYKFSNSRQFYSDLNWRFRSESDQVGDDQLANS